MPCTTSPAAATAGSKFFGRSLERAARVRRLEAYAWSSYPGYVDAGKRLEFVYYDLLADYGRTMPEARRQYRAYVHACVLESDGPIIEAG